MGTESRLGDHTHDSTHTGAPLAGLKRLPSVPEPVRKSSARAGRLSSTELIDIVC